MRDVREGLPFGSAFAGEAGDQVCEALGCVDRDERA
jgi:hypothetical protein